MRFDLALAASEARSVVTSHCNTLSVFFVYINMVMMLLQFVKSGVMGLWLQAVL